MSATGGDAGALRNRILDLVREYHAAAFGAPEFVAGESAIPYAGRVFDANEVVNLVDASLDFWLTSGRYAAEFEKRFASAFGVRTAMLVNSGSSANLLALSALTSPRLDERPRTWGASRRLRQGDEVITVAAGFPTTVNPIIQNGLVPVFVDVTLPTYNIDVSQLEAALSDRTRAVMVAHALGNPFEVDVVAEFARTHDLWLIEDCCDAVGSTYKGQPVGTFGDIATTSFYPAHHITMGEGGCVLTNRGLLKLIVESMRDWGRDCWCDPGKANTCSKRFGWQLGELPHGYDHKYTYSNIGYNLKATDMQAAVGVAQLDKLDDFVAARKRNFAYLAARLSSLSDLLVMPEATPGADPSWFGFPVAVRADAPITRDQVVAHLEQNGVATRLLFAGNLTRQPAYRDVNFRKVGDLPVTDFVMTNVLWVGVYPGLSEAMLDHMVSTFLGIRALATGARA